MTDITAATTERQEVVVYLRPIPGSPWLTQDHGCRTSIIDFHHCKPDGPAVRLTGVTLNGRPLKFCLPDVPSAASETTVWVAPMVPMEGDYLALYFSKEATLYRGPQLRQALPSPIAVYGLQPPSGRPQRDAIK